MLVSGREAFAWCHECGLQRQIDIEQLSARVGEQYSLINRRSPCPECGAWMRFHYRQAALYPMWEHIAFSGDFLWERAAASVGRKTLHLPQDARAA